MTLSSIKFTSKTLWSSGWWREVLESQRQSGTNIVESHFHSSSRRVLTNGCCFPRSSGELWICGCFKCISLKILYTGCSLILQLLHVLAVSPMQKLGYQLNKQVLLETDKQLTPFSRLQKVHDRVQDCGALICCPNRSSPISLIKAPHIFMQWLFHYSAFIGLTGLVGFPGDTYLSEALRQSLFPYHFLFKEAASFLAL